jgi:curved DNA-binding protein CbpA
LELWEEDLYELLVVSPDATPEEIKKAYKKLAIELHPDRFPDDADKRAHATERFGKITNAYNVLKDEEQKAEYDFARRMLGGMSGGSAPTSAGGAPSAAGPSAASSMADESISEAKKSQAQNQYDQGKVYHGAKNWQKAIALYKEAIRLDPTVADYHAYLGVAYKQQGLKTPAQNAFAAAYKLDKKHKLLKDNYTPPGEEGKKGKGKKGDAKPSLIDQIMALFQGGKKDVKGGKGAKGKPGAAKKGTAPLKKASAKK